MKRGRSCLSPTSLLRCALVYNTGHISLHANVEPTLYLTLPAPAHLPCPDRFIPVSRLAMKAGPAQGPKDQPRNNGTNIINHNYQQSPRLRRPRTARFPAHSARSHHRRRPITTVLRILMTNHMPPFNCARLSSSACPHASRASRHRGPHGKTSAPARHGYPWRQGSALEQWIWMFFTAVPIFKFLVSNTATKSVY